MAAQTVLIMQKHSIFNAVKKIKLIHLHTVAMLMLASQFTYAQSTMILCDQPPSDSLSCQQDIHYQQTLEPVIPGQSAGQTDTVRQKTFYFILLLSENTQTDTVAFKLNVETDPLIDIRSLIDQYDVITQYDWNYCWKSWTFYRPGIYTVDATINGKLVTNDLLILNDTKNK